MRHLDRLAIAHGVALLLVALAVPSSPLQAQSSGVLHGCVNPGNGNLRIVGAQEACRPNEARVQLNVASPPAATLGRITGQLTACQPTDFTGVLVHIPGRAFSVFTGADGSFQIDNVPTGSYDIEIEFGGSVLHALNGVIVGSDAVSVGEVLVADTSSDPNHCGACNNACNGGACVNGTCQTGGGGQCVPGAVESCYTGPMGTLGVGACQAGTRVCSANNTFGACTGETLPAAEICGDGIDNNCDGQVDEGCQAGQCTSALDCGVPTACRTPICVAGQCAFEFAPAGTVCEVGFCDGQGSCIAPGPGGQ